MAWTIIEKKRNVCERTKGRALRIYHENSKSVRDSLGKGMARISLTFSPDTLSFFQIGEYINVMVDEEAGLIGFNNGKSGEGRKLVKQKGGGLYYTQVTIPASQVKRWVGHADYIDIMDDDLLIGPDGEMVVHMVDLTPSIRVAAAKRAVAQ